MSMRIGWFWKKTVLYSVISGYAFSSSIIYFKLNRKAYVV